MTQIITAIVVVLVLLILCITNIVESRKRAQQNNNYLAVRNRNLAIVYGFLCIILILSIILNREEFVSNHLNKCPMNEQMNATTPDEQVCPWAVNEHGSTVARVNLINLAGILLIPLLKTQTTIVKAVRLKVERDKYKTLVTRTFTLKSMPTIEQYLS